MISIRILLFTALTALSLAASATPQQRDATDLWIDPAESGWGLNVFHQGDTLFASLFVYGVDGQPKWYTASALTGSSVYTGDLTEAAGPSFSEPFDPARVTRRTVGQMTFTLGPMSFMSADADSATVDYTIDGVRVTRQVRRFAFAATNLAGTFRGYRYERQSGGLQVRHDEKVSPVISAVLIVGGIGLMIAGSRK